MLFVEKEIAEVQAIKELRSTVRNIRSYNIVTKSNITSARFTMKSSPPSFRTFAKFN